MMSRPGRVVWPAQLDLAPAARSWTSTQAVEGAGFVDDTEDIVARIRCLVTCERETERIVGGDRVEGTNILV